MRIEVKGKGREGMRMKRGKNSRKICEKEKIGWEFFPFPLLKNNSHFLFFSLLSHTPTTLTEKLLLLLSLEYFYQLMNSCLFPLSSFFHPLQLFLPLFLLSFPSFSLSLSLSRVSFIHRSLFPTCILLLPINTSEVSS